ncbi:hypothetical protein NXC24_PC00446 (plasmid) [Rhizobium sp. NXC24]|nr:hypothetical protein NXC24_PC00446 [Rhizobium sp. NXC24]
MCVPEANGPGYLVAAPIVTLRRFDLSDKSTEEAARLIAASKPFVFEASHIVH